MEIVIDALNNILRSVLSIIKKISLHLSNPKRTYICPIICTSLELLGENDDTEG